MVPVYNREKELVRTFASIVAQTYRPLHVVLVDNGSTDGSLALCRELKARYEGDDLEVTVTQVAKRGPSAARNRGLSCVREEFVSFFDSDDTYIPEAIARYMQAFDSHPQADIVGCTVEMVPEEGRPYRAKAVFSNRVEPHLFHCTLGTQRYAVRTALVRAVGGWRGGVRAVGIDGVEAVRDARQREVRPRLYRGLVVHRASGRDGRGDARRSRVPLIYGMGEALPVALHTIACRDADAPLCQIV